MLLKPSGSGIPRGGAARKAAARQGCRFHARALRGGYAQAFPLAFLSRAEGRPRLRQGVALALGFSLVRHGRPGLAGFPGL